MRPGFCYHHHWRLSVLVIFVAALGLRLLLFAAWHTDDFSRFDSGDYPLYAIGAQHFDAYGTFDNSLFLVRPPLFSLIVYALNHDEAAVIVLNSVVGALIAALTCVLGRRLGLSDGGAWFAGGLVALDPAGVVYSAFLGPEPLANLFLLAAVICVLILATHEGNRGAILWGAAAGICLVLSAYTRPAAYLLWPVLAVWLLIINRRQWRAMVVMVLISAIGVGSWIIHNGRVFNYYTFSTIAPYTMVYYHAASVEHLATGHDMDTVYTSINRRVEERLGHDTAGVGADERHGYLAATPDVADALNRVAVEIFVDHPLITLLTIPIGFTRMYGLSTHALGQSPLAVRALETAWNAVFLLSAVAGLWLAFRRRQWLLGWCVLLISGYFTVGTLIVKSAGMTPRERTMLAPFMAVAMAYAVMVFLARRRTAAHAHSPALRLENPDQDLA